MGVRRILVVGDSNLVVNQVPPPCSSLLLLFAPPSPPPGSPHPLSCFCLSPRVTCSGAWEALVRAVYLTAWLVCQHSRGPQPA